MPGTRQCDTQPPANRESLPSLAGPPPQGGGFGNIRRTNQSCRRPRERKSGCGLGARPRGQLQTMNSCPCGGQDTWSQSECALPPKFPALLGERRPSCVGSRKQKGKERWQVSAEKGTVFHFPHRKLLWPGSLLYPDYSQTRAPEQRSFASGSSVGQGLLHAKEKRNLLAEYFLDILQDARPP